MLPIEPAALVRQWLTAVLTAAGRGSTVVTTQLDPRDGLPQLVIESVRPTVPQSNTGQPDRVLRRVLVGLYAAGKGGDRPDFQSAYGLLQPVLDALEGLRLDPWTSGDGAVRVIGAGGVSMTRRRQPDAGLALYVATFELTVVLTS